MVVAKVANNMQFETTNQAFSWSGCVAISLKYIQAGLMAYHVRPKVAGSS
jgi:hypothetical protein